MVRVLFFVVRINHFLTTKDSKCTKERQRWRLGAPLRGNLKGGGVGKRKRRTAVDYSF